MSDDEARFKPKKQSEFENCAEFFNSYFGLGHIRPNPK